MEFPQPKVLLKDNRLDCIHHHGTHVLDDYGNSTARAPNWVVWIVCSRGLDVAQDTGKTEGMSALADARADKVAEADGTDILVLRYCDALSDHSYRFPAHAMIRSVE